MKLITSISISLISIWLLAQKPLEKGFSYLESGNYQEAELFFEEILQEEPQNFTASICYGRAIGLKGETEKALGIFNEMKNNYPENEEVNLNYGEALLWNKKYMQAKELYKNLTERYPNNAVAHLGYANSLSEMKEYETSYQHIQKADELLPNNPGVKNSLKYIRLGYAQNLLQSNKKNQALKLLTLNDLQFPNDKDVKVSLFNLFLVLKKYDTAHKTLDSWSPTYEKDSIVRNLSSSLLQHLMHKESKALKIAKEIYESNFETADQSTKVLILERYVQALIWNKKFAASKKVVAQNKSLLSDKQYHLLVAQQASYLAQTKKISQSAVNILKEDAKSVDAQLYSINALMSEGNYKEAEKWISKTKKEHPYHNALPAMKKKLEKYKSPMLRSQTYFSQDNGKNQAIQSEVNFSYPLNYTIALRTRFIYRNTQQPDNSFTNNYEALLGIDWRFLPKWTLSASSIPYKTVADNSFTQILFKSDVSYQFNALSNLEIGVSQNMENFNTQLVNSNLKMTNYYAILNYYSGKGLGIFSQYFYSQYSDDNLRGLVYASMYYSLGNKPLIKLAINYQNMSFQESRPELYFSPNQFSLWEAMSVIESPIYEDFEKQWLYQFTIGFGSQQIEENDSQLTSRFRGELGYKWNNHNTIYLYGGHSNIATSNAVGFAYSEIGLKFNVLF